MLSVWWDFKGIVYFGLLPRNQTINSNVYCRQLMKLDKKIKEKRPEPNKPNLINTQISCSGTHQINVTGTQKRIQWYSNTRTHEDVDSRWIHRIFKEETQKKLATRSRVLTKCSLKVKFSPCRCFNKLVLGWNSNLMSKCQKIMIHSLSLVLGKLKFLFYFFIFLESIYTDFLCFHFLILSRSRVFQLEISKFLIAVSSSFESRFGANLFLNNTFYTKICWIFFRL